MAKYLLQGNYDSKGVQGLVKEGGSSRREAASKIATMMGGSVECVYYAFGDTDIYMIVDMPDNVDAAAAVLSVGAAGGGTTVKTTVLLTPEEIDEAVKKTPAYRPPGQ